MTPQEVLTLINERIEEYRAESARTSGDANTRAYHREQALKDLRRELGKAGFLDPDPDSELPIGSLRVLADGGPGMIGRKGIRVMSGGGEVKMVKRVQWEAGWDDYPHLSLEIMGAPVEIDATPPHTVAMACPLCSTISEHKCEGQKIFTQGGVPVE